MLREERDALGGPYEGVEAYLEGTKEVNEIGRKPGGLARQKESRMYEKGIPSERWPLPLEKYVWRKCNSLF
jgi:hypothetical protein